MCLTVDDAVLIAGLARALVRACLRELEAGEPPSPAAPEVLEAAMWRAARYGVGGELVSPGALEPAPAADVVGELLEKVGPDLDELGDTQDVTARAEAVLVAGNGAGRQRAAGPEGAVDMARALLLPAD